MLIVAGSHIMFAGLITFAQYGVNAIQTGVTIFLRHNRAGLKLYFRALRQFDRFKRAEYAALIDRMDRLHAFFYHVVGGNASQSRAAVASALGSA